MDKDWTQFNGYFRSDKAFLFSIDKKTKYKPINNDNNGYMDATNWGPCFANDLYIGYCHPQVFSFPDANALSGSESWTADETEFFAIET